MSKEDQENELSEEEMKVVYKIENVVATVTVEVEDKIDLVQIARKNPEVEYNPERFPGVILRMEKPKATFLIFSTGKMVLTGLSKASEAEKAVKKVMKILKQSKIDVANPEIIIQNIVASGDLNVFVDLNMATLLMDNVMYEPEIFPGLIFRLQDPKAVFLIFSTGKIVCTGIKTKEILDEAIQRLQEELKDMDFIHKHPEINQEEQIVFL